MGENLVRVVLDTNILVSAIVYGGKPRVILSLVLEKKIKAIISLPLLGELLEVLSKKFSLTEEILWLIEKQIKEQFVFVRPRKVITILKDKADNLVLEAGAEGGCRFIVTGDKELLSLKKFKKLKILTASQFLNFLETRKVKKEDLI